MTGCKYLDENEGKLMFDEVAECPRYLGRYEQCILLNFLGVELSDFGSRLVHFVDEHGDMDSHIPIDDFFDNYYKPLYNAFRRMERAVDSCYKVTYTHFMGKDY